MNCARIFWIGIVIAPLLMWLDASATNRTPRNDPSVQGIGGMSQATSKSSKLRPAAKHAPSDKNRHAEDRGAQNDYRSGYTAGLRDGKHAIAQMQREHRDALAAEKTAIREHGERDARVERIYRSSQLSAPIIVDARACRRIGMHGESIYENCQLAGH